MEEKIVIKGAREHNLKNIDLEIPRNKLVVFTGISGSGKSSLAFDTIFAEGQRRYVESLSSYARQFLGQMNKPDVDYIEGLSPAISIDQKATSHNPRSTVGTVTEIYDYLRLLYARIGKPHCPKCNKVISRQTVDQMIELINDLGENTRIMILAPVVRGRKGEYHQLLYDLYRGGFSRVRVNGEVKNLNDKIELERYKAHSIEVVVDRLIIGQSLRSRLSEALESALKLARGLVIIKIEDKDESPSRKALDDQSEIMLSEQLSCPNCNISFGDIAPRTFSFNSPYGACSACHGLGFKKEVDPTLVMPNEKLTIAEGGVLPALFSEGNYYGAIILSASKFLGINVNIQIKLLSEREKQLLMYGVETPQRITVRYWALGRARTFETNFIGIIPYLEKRYLETESDAIRDEIEHYMISKTCLECHGTRLKPESLLVRVGGKNIAELSSLATEQIATFFKELKISRRDTLIAERILKEVQNRIDFLVRVGLDYLTLDRAAMTLSGGEAQRIRLASQIGSSLVGVLYVLDEPTIGLHQRDNQRLVDTLKSLRDLGNSVIVVEHDEETIRQADFIVDIGPGAGELGGKIVATGNLENIIAESESITGQYLSGKKKIEIPKKRRVGNKKFLIVEGARENNLKNIKVKIPLGKFVGITGVSGSGKSTLVDEILYKALMNKLHGAYEKPGRYLSISGLEHIDKVIIIDQSPIGRTPRSNSATYTKTFDHIRDLFARTIEAKSRGYMPGRFSFNVEGGRCANCRGDGLIKIEMHFLPDIYISCEVCHGQRYNRETLEVRWQSKNIAQVLDMTVKEATEFFSDIPQIKDKLQTLADVGLGYIKLGQSATTLSGGEAQRIKLAAELSKRSTGRTFYILDEPTTGLHFADVEKLLEVLNRLVNLGNTVLLIEHNMDVIKTLDWIIDLGPEGGEKGGKIVAQGTPEDIKENVSSYTGQYLKKFLK
ncbi:MAG: excinuclease ABC subunit UvrA [bacterium]|nr:excinuclease ABC subunit UvrA [bacterium]